MMTELDTMPELRGDLRFSEPLAQYTSWRVGGPAKQFYRPADLADLCAFLRRLPAHEPLLWLGLGSNLLVRDGGFHGTVIMTHGALQMLGLSGELGIRVEAGVPCAKAARFSARHCLTGGEFLAGIPGTMGGALAMNAGAWGSETWEWVSGVETVSRDGKVHFRSAAEYVVAYRQVRGPEHEWFVAARLQLMPGDADTALARIRQLLEQRSRTQPTGVASCGSVFRNPPGDFAARLIETAGLKGLANGDACVSIKHANFILNKGRATAEQLEELIEKVADAVDRLHGVRLQTEVRMVGETAAERRARDE